MAIEKIYSVYEKGDYIGDFCSSELRGILSMSPSAFSAAISRKTLIKNRYKIVQSDLTLSPKNPLWAEFDRLTKQVRELLPSAKDK